MSKKNRLIYLPLGGAGEVGMNAYVYGYGPEGNERLILVDAGVTFPDMETTPGVDLIMPDIAWLAERVSQLEAIFITHAHEDHIGALAHLWPKLRARVYARKFTAEIGKAKFEEVGLDTSIIGVVSPYPQEVSAGPFKVSFLPVAHSIPESSALVIETPAGRILHTGDFKLDGNPMVGEPFEAKLWHEVGRKGIKALVCDSTNIFVDRQGRSEATLGPEIAKLIFDSPGLVAATTFASNVARIRTLAVAAEDAGRSVVVMGRAMFRMIEAAESTGILTDLPRLLTPEEAEDVPRERLVLIVTGSQGERRAASAQLSRGKYLGFEMKAGDTFLFSSKTIPGNEKSVGRIINAFSEIGVNVVEDRDGSYHVSGHANRPDLEAVHRLMKPAMLIPMHGEHRHLAEHARVGAAAGIPTEVVPNGTMVDLSGAKPQIVEHVETGRTYLDGSVLIGALDGVVRDRLRMALFGHVMVTLIVEEDSPLGDAWAEIMGLPETGRSRAPLAETIEIEVNEFLKRADKKIMRDDDKIEETVTRIVRQAALEEVGKKPEVTVVISRLST